jgi:hypothetical protein
MFMFLMSIEELVRHAADREASHRVLTIIFAVVFMSVGVGWFLYATYIKRVPWWLALCLGSPEKHGTLMKITSILMVCFAVLVLALVFSGPSPDEAAELARNCLEDMQRGVKRISVFGEGEVGNHSAIIKDQPALERFSAAVAQSVPISRINVGYYYSGDATVHTRDGTIIELYFRCYPLSANGIQFVLKHRTDSATSRVTELRNDDIGGLFAEALGFKLVE